MYNLILSILAIVLFVIIEPISLIYTVFIKKRFKWGRLSGYFRSFAVDVDRFGNHHFRSFLNAILIQKQGYQFGDFRETISSVLGKNQRDNTLSKSGKILAFILDTIDKNHCLNSIQDL